MKYFFTRYLPVLSCILLLASCGFQLRGSFDLPPGLDSIHVRSPVAYADLENALVSTSHSRGVNVVSAAQAAPITVEILNANYSQTINSISASANTRQYMLRYTTRYQFLDQQGKVIFGPTSTMVARSLTINANQILGSTNEEDTLKQEMQQETARNILSALSSAEIASAISES